MSAVSHRSRGFGFDKLQAAVFSGREEVHLKPLLVAVTCDSSVRRT